MITINCPKCKKIFNVKDEFAGKTGKCHICKTSIQVPVPFIEPSVKKVSVSSESETRNNSQLKSYKNLNWLKFAAFGIGEY